MYLSRQTRTSLPPSVVAPGTRRYTDQLFSMEVRFVPKSTEMKG